MKKVAPYIVLILFAMLIWSIAADSYDFMTVNIDGEEIGGPLGALVGLVFAGGGALIGMVVMVCVGLLLAVVFAGVGVIVIGALAFAAGAVILAISPLLLPLLIPVALIWFFVSRSRKPRVTLEKAAA